MTRAATENLVNRKLLTLCRAIASFMITKAQPHAIATTKSAQGANFIFNRWRALLTFYHVAFLAAQLLACVSPPYLESPKLVGR